MNMRIARTVTLLLSLSGMCLAGQAQAAELGATDESIKLAINEWTGQHVTARIAGDIFVGKVIHIVDGDTLTLVADEERFQVELLGVDAPEREQPFGAESKKCLGELSFGKTVRVVDAERDLQGGLVGRVRVGGLDLGSAMVRRGCAWVQPSHRHDSAALDGEARARRGQLGLWANASAISPWEWRDGVRTTPREAGGVRGFVVGNARTLEYHPPGCAEAARVSPSERVLFLSTEAAAADGYRLAASCR